MGESNPGEKVGVGNTTQAVLAESGTVTPAVGDIVAAFIRSAGSFNAGVSIMYHGEDPS